MDGVGFEGLENAEANRKKADGLPGGLCRGLLLLARVVQEVAV